VTKVIGGASIRPAMGRAFDYRVSRAGRMARRRMLKFPGLLPPSPESLFHVST